MFGKINIHHHLKNAKSFINRGYNTTKHIAGTIDRHMMTAKKIYSIIAPVIENLGGSSNFNKLNKQVMNRVSDYETIKNKVQHVEDNINQVTSGLSKNKINLGLD